MLPYLKNEIDTKSFENYLFSMDEQDLIYCIVYPLCILAIRSTSTFHFGILPYVFSCINYCCWPHSCCCNGGKMYLCRSAVFTLVLLLQSLIMGKHKTHYWWLQYSMQYSPDFSKKLKVVFSRHGLQWIEYTFFPNHTAHRGSLTSLMSSQVSIGPSHGALFCPS